MQNSRSVILVESLAFGFCLILLGLWIYVANDETQPLVGIFRLTYLIPTFLYAWFMLLPSIAIYHLFRRLLKWSLSLLVSIVVGVPLGVIVTMRVAGWIL